MENWTRLVVAEFDQQNRHRLRVEDCINGEYVWEQWAHPKNTKNWWEIPEILSTAWNVPDSRAFLVVLPTLRDVRQVKIVHNKAWRRDRSRHFAEK